MDLIIRNVRLTPHAAPLDIGVTAGRITALHPDIPRTAAVEHDGGGCLAFPGFVESHIHLDKAATLHRCGTEDASLAAAIRKITELKATFTVQDVHDRGARVLRDAITHGTTVMQSFVEVDHAAGLRSLEGLLALAEEARHAIDLRLCAFAQDGLTQHADGEALLEEALRLGARSIGGCPYTDPDPQEQIRRILALAARHDCDADFHIDFDLDPTASALPFLIRHVLETGYRGRVVIGHATKLSILPTDEQTAILDGLLAADIMLTALPATDLFLMRGSMAPLMRYARMGGRCALATNNIVNPFTPFGDGNLLRMGNLFANITGATTDADLALIWDMLTTSPASSLGVPAAITEGAPADIVLIDAPDPATAVRELRPVLGGWKAGVWTFVRHRPEMKASF
ncbi:N-isopropylammelide isopropylaminohydrolase [Gluconacetobacter diazotrophicus PA1 5]|uniref:Amidohydrolase family protein n=1 Tax=Gluconacetobacter diazotrophicus TaxID=33996 RepID=A0A7W4I5U9_GLUDI|nr:amidohydrolase family protein [Gluconacetobacter diazotrophicus]ACI52262.1 N-isopropylammelide isopropylaminohydrolase [Gluconacetobacter diazotrophicus PA1 5]MBB2156814.1 amidohydrolase family protein [Gluconacetobacter diazotrophicus]TWB04843.1 cytosine deaminase [Gluconacetobacter diazotrophicus]